MQIPDETFWSALGCMGAVVAWLLTLERRLNARLTRKEHTEICDKANKELSDKMDNLQRELAEQRRDIKTQNEQALMHRQLVGETLTDIRLNVAVLTERLKKRSDDPDAGPHQRRI